MTDEIGKGACQICRGRRKVCVGISFPPKSTVGVKAEYDPCPCCTKPPHTFHAKRTAQILQKMRSRSAQTKQPAHGC